MLEYKPKSRFDILPPTSYMEGTNGTLAREVTRLVTDDNGFMVSDKPYQEGDLKMLLLGASSIENLYIPERSRILVRLEDIHNTAGERVKVYSAGISGAHLLHCFNLFVNKGLGLRPSVAVLYPAPWYDLMANEVENTFWHPSGRMTPIREAGTELDLNLTATICNRNRFEDEKSLLRSLFDICSNFGVSLAVSTWPLYGRFDDCIRRFQTADPLVFQREEEQSLVLNEIVRQVCYEKQGILIDLEKAFGALDHSEYFYDRYHPNVKGCEFIAQQTSRALKS